MAFFPQNQSRKLPVNKKLVTDVLPISSPLGISLGEAGLGD